MNAAIKHDQSLPPEYSMKNAVIYSTVFHLALFGITAFGLPFVATDPLVISNPINVEIVNIDEMTQTNKLAPPKKKAEEETPAPPKQEQAKQMTAETPPDLLSPKPPEPEKPEEKTPPEEVVPEPVKKEAEKPPPPKPEKPKAKPKPPEPEAPKQEDQFASLLKNLTPDKADSSDAEDAPDPTQENASPLSQIAQLSDKLTISELDAFKQQIAPCWNVPAGSKFAEELVVEVRVIMNRDMSVQNASILDQGRYNRDSHFRAAADAALRALRNPRCQPLKLPQGKYDQWKTIVIRFDPREML